MRIGFEAAMERVDDGGQALRGGWRPGTYVERAADGDRVKVTAPDEAESYDPDARDRDADDWFGRA